MQVRLVVLTAYLALTLLFGSRAAHAQYTVINLASNQEGVAKHTDPLLVDPWGMAHHPGGNWWISDELSGYVTAYASSGAKVNNDYLIPPIAGSGPGSPTGQVYNPCSSCFGAAYSGLPNSTDFKIDGQPTGFLFVTFDGTISGWAPMVAFYDPIIAVSNPGASYTGLAISSRGPTGNVLFAADNMNNKVDIYDGDFNLVSSFTDTTLPAGFAPFGIQDFGGQVYVTFASTSGASGGFIDIFNESGTLLQQLTNDPHLNQPWGLAMAPSDFGPLSNTLLVSNNTNGGTINAFNAVTGQFVGTMMNTNNEEIQINGLWGIAFGDGLGTPDGADNGATNQLFFTAGPDTPNLFASLFGAITFGNTTSTFTLASSASALTVNSGSQGSLTLTVTPQNGFKAPVTFTCSGLPAGGACSFNPSSITPSGSAVQTTLTVATSASASAVRPARYPFLPAAGLALAGCLLLIRKRRTLALYLVPVGAFLALSGLTACGGGGSANTGGGGGTQPTNYTVTVTATSGTLTQSTNIALTLTLN